MKIFEHLTEHNVFCLETEQNYKPAKKDPPP